MTLRYALDFDGVICDSALETALSAWRAARIIWPDLPLAIPDEILTDFRNVRPALETGFEGILIHRCLIEGTSTTALLNDYSQQIDAVRQKYQIDNGKLKSLFANVRDQWIADDFDGWIGENPLYPGIAEFLRQIPRAQLFIITTKQERFVHAILKANGISLAETQIYGLERQQSKNQILDAFSDRHHDKIIFVEDRLQTLLQVINTATLEEIDLWLADWGYNTQSDRQVARQTARINILSLENLNRLLI